MQTQLKSNGPDFGCPNTISKFGSKVSHPCIYHGFKPSCQARWRRCTALCLIQNILWKSSECCVDRLRPPLAENQIPLIPPLLPLLSSRILMQNIFSGQEAIKLLWDTQPDSQNPNLYYYVYFLIHPPGEITELKPHSPELCMGPVPLLALPVIPVKHNLKASICKVHLGSEEMNFGQFSMRTA